MRHHRWLFQDQLDALEVQLQDLGSAALDVFAAALKTTAEPDPGRCEQFSVEGRAIAGQHQQIQNAVLGLLALQAPVASDLRLLTAVQQAATHLERVATMGVTVADLTAACYGLPAHDQILRRLEDMGDIALPMQAAAMDAFARRDRTLCDTLAASHGAVTRMHASMLDAVLDTAPDRDLLRWGVGMHGVSRGIARVAGHAVEIGHLVCFLLGADEPPPAPGAPHATLAPSA